MNYNNISCFPSVSYRFPVTYNDPVKNVRLESPTTFQVLPPHSYTPTSHLFCIGGKVPSGKCVVSKYVPGDRKWTSVHELDVNFISCPVTSIGDKIYIGKSSYGYKKDTFYEYDCSTLSLRSLRDLPHKRIGLALTSLGNSLFTSGEKEKAYNQWGDIGHHRKPKNDAFRFDITRNRWEKIANMNKHRHGHVMVTGNEIVYAIGGYFGKTAIEEFHHGANFWLKTDVRLMLIPRDSLSAAFHEGVIYVCTGLNQFYRVTPRQPPFQERILPPPNSKTNSLVSYNGKLLSVGGCLKGSQDKTGMVYEFDARTNWNNCWIRLPDMDVPRKRHAFVVVNY